MTGNHTTKKFYVYYQPKTNVTETLDVERNYVDRFVAQYPETTLLFFDPKTQSFKELALEDFHPDGSYSLVNKYGNVVALMNVYTAEPKKEVGKNEKEVVEASKDHLFTQNEQDTTKAQEKKTQDTGSFGNEHTGSSTEQKQATSADKPVAPVLQDKAQPSVTPTTTDLPQTGETKHQASILGLLALGLASLFTLVNFDRKKETK